MAAEPRLAEISSWIELSNGGTTTVIRIAGELDTAARPSIEPVLLEAAAAGAPVVVDAEDLSFCDSNGLAMFIVAQQRAVAAGTTLTIRRASPRFRRLLRITGIETMLCVTDGDSAVGTRPPRNAARLDVPG
jgi:anti-sigma B factor antagonist